MTDQASGGMAARQDFDLLSPEDQVEKPEEKPLSPEERVKRAGEAYIAIVKDAYKETILSDDSTFSAVMDVVECTLRVMTELRDLKRQYLGLADWPEDEAQNDIDDILILTEDTMENANDSLDDAFYWFQPECVNAEDIKRIAEVLNAGHQKNLALLAKESGIEIDAEPIAPATYEELCADIDGDGSKFIMSMENHLKNLTPEMATPENLDNLQRRINFTGRQVSQALEKRKREVEDNAA